MIIILEFGKKLKLSIKYIRLLFKKKKLLNQKPSFHVIPCANKEKAWEIVDEVRSIEPEELLETIIDYPTDLEEEKALDGENKYYHTEMYLIDNKTFDMQFVYLDGYVEQISSIFVNFI